MVIAGQLEYHSLHTFGCLAIALITEAWLLVAQFCLCLGELWDFSHSFGLLGCITWVVIR